MKTKETKNDNEFNFSLISTNNPLFNKVIKTPKIIIPQLIECNKNGEEVNLSIIMDNILKYKTQLKKNKKKHFKILTRMFNDVKNHDTKNHVTFVNVFMDLWEDIFIDEKTCLSVSNKKYQQGIESVFNILINSNLKTM